MAILSVLPYLMCAFKNLHILRLKRYYVETARTVLGHFGAPIFLKFVDREAKIKRDSADFPVTDISQRHLCCKPLADRNLCTLSQ